MVNQLRAAHDSTISTRQYNIHVQCRALNFTCKNPKNQKTYVYQGKLCELKNKKVLKQV